MRRKVITALVIGGVSCTAPTDQEEPTVASTGMSSGDPPTFAVFSPRPFEDPTMVCIPLEGGCLRLNLEFRPSPAHFFRSGTWVGPECSATEEPIAHVVTFDGSATAAGGGILVEGPATLDDGTVLEFDVSAQHAEPLGTYCERDRWEGTTG